MNWRRWRGRKGCRPIRRGGRGTPGRGPKAPLSAHLPRSRGRVRRPLVSAPRPRLVVRNHAPARRALLLFAALAAVVVAVLGAFEFGRYRAGFDGAAARAE